MAQTGYTPIQLYYSTTAAAVPTAGNLNSGELAINITDGKLYYKSNAGVVTLLAGATAGPAGGSNTQVQFNSSGALAGSANMTFNGTTLTAGGLTTTGTTSTGVLSVTGNTTLGDAAADAVTVNGTVTSNLIFTDNTYDIGASGATRPRNLFLASALTVGTTASIVGGVGIGNSPTFVAQLTIRGDGATSQIRAQASTNSNQGLSFIYNYASQYGQINCDEQGVNQLDLWYTALSHKFGRNTSSALMTLDASGNLVLGTASAISGYLLTVNGQGAFTGPSSDVDGNGGVRINYGTASGVIQRYLTLNGNGTTSAAIGAVLTDSSNGGMIFSTRGGNVLNEVVRITSTGRLGIGTTNPATALDVAGSITTTGAVQFNGTDASMGTGQIKYITGAGLSIQAKTGSGYDFTLFGAAGNNIMRIPTGTVTLDFPQTGVIFNTTGVGIGTASPSGKLDVTGRTYMRASGSDSVLTFFNQSGGDGSITVTGTSNTMNYVFNTFSTGNALYIANTGNIIVGSTGGVDSAKFQIFGAKVYSSGIPQQQLNIADTSTIAAGAGGAVVFSAQYLVGSYTSMGSVEGVRETATVGHYGGSLLFRTRTNFGDNSERMRITSDGNVGIGLSNPSIKLTTLSTTNRIAAFESQASGSVTGINYNAIIGRSTNSIPHSTTTEIAGGYGGGIVLIVMRNVTGNDTQYTYVVTWGWNSASVLFSNSYGSTGTTSTFTASGGGLYVSHDHTTGNCYYALSALINGTS